MFIKIRKYFLMLIAIFVCSTFALADTGIKTPLLYLSSMTEAHKKSNYELFYILQQDTSVESFRFRHAFVNDKEYAQLLNLDHNREEIILKENNVSYLGYNFRPFSLSSLHILDNLPNVIYADYHHLKGYIFLDAGKDRISDRIAKVIRILPKDNFRYSYTLWIDEETNLLLKSQLQNEDSVVLEEFRVLQLYQSQEIAMIANAIEALMLPTLTSTQKYKMASPYNWEVNELPIGFRLVQSQTVSGTAYQFDSEYVDSRLYSDGLSSFTIYVMPVQGVNFDNYAWQQGKLTILNQTINNRDIVIIGNVPLETAKHILTNIQFREGDSQ
ncbi:MucB/RseB C-terminal domain-containing protein [Mannheimia sp. E30BD]|uniref:MucB/RseB C-terminal domain-containing protein n=1 Tax=Mannheimia sp. E30BD TaxID=3278708 RepID=UPI00359F01AE